MILGGSDPRDAGLQGRDNRYIDPRDGGPQSSDSRDIDSWDGGPWDRENCNGYPKNSKLLEGETQNVRNIYPLDID